jgi:hypothetical protein
MHAHKILLVADRTAGEPHVAAVLHARAAQVPIEVTLVVPSTPPRAGWIWDEAASRADARRRMNAAVASLRRLGIAARAVLGDFSPLEAIRDEMRRRAYDEIVISTLPTRTSRWLRLDLPARVGREFTVPVTHVQAETEPDRLAPARSRRVAA